MHIRHFKKDNISEKETGDWQLSPIGEQKHFLKRYMVYN